MLVEQSHWFKAISSQIQNLEFQILKFKQMGRVERGRTLQACAEPFVCGACTAPLLHHFLFLPYYIHSNFTPSLTDMGQSLSERVLHTTHPELVLTSISIVLRFSKPLRMSAGRSNGRSRHQIGCINGIFHAFLSGHRHKTGNLLLPGSQGQPPKENCPEIKKEKPRTSKESHSTIPSPKDQRSRSLDLWDVAKDSVYREARGLSVKSRTNATSEKKAKVLKHIDSPRPSLHLDSEKSRGVKNSKEDRLVLPRFSYDGRESRDTGKFGGKHKEHPRLSLDSKTSSMKYSALESRANFLVRENEALAFNHEPVTPGHHRSSSGIVAKLMGLEEFPDTTSLFDNSTPTTKTCPKEDSLTRKSRFPEEYATRGQQDANAQWRVPLSVYGEIEKRIAELEFKKSGKDLRALKQILEAMEKTKERLQNVKGEPGHLRNDGLSPVVIMKPVKVADKVNNNSSSPEIRQLQRVQTRVQKGKDLSSKNTIKDSQQHSPSSAKKSASGRSYGTRSPRSQQNLVRTASSRPAAPLSESRQVKKSSHKKIAVKGTHNRQTKVKPQLSDDYLSEISSETRYSSYQCDTASVKSESNNSLVSIETEIINSAQKKNHISRARRQMLAVESIITTVEQPSPISVLDDAFYCEDSPSPVKKTSTHFPDDIPSPVESEWHFEDTKKIRKLKFSCNEPEETYHDMLMLAGGNPDRRYINKVLLTSGLLKNSSIISAADRHIFSSYHLINPDMFYIIEQTEDFHDKNNQGTKLDKRIHRKIIFDMVDEILVRKINSGRFSEGKKTRSPEALLNEIYLEMDRACLTSEDGEDEIARLLTEDIKYRSDEWEDCKGEVPSLVLDIERLLFKDLITEVVKSEVVEVQNWPKRYQRQLFRK